MITGKKLKRRLKRAEWWHRFYCGCDHPFCLTRELAEQTARNGRRPKR